MVRRRYGMFRLANPKASIIAFCGGQIRVFVCRCTQLDSWLPAFERKRIDHGKLTSFIPARKEGSHLPLS
jgi:xanthine/CO dehydrogenase XdhC/CoxF family maturation factor